MSCNCNETTNQGKQYCQDCMPDEFHWLVPVSKEPDPFLMDRNHAYIGPNNIIYVLSRDRVRAIKITTSEGNIDLSPYALKEELASKISELTTKLTEGLEGAKYFEGEGIRIDEDNRIHSTVTLTEVNQRLDSLEQVDTSPYKAGTGIKITPDLTINSTVDVSGLDSRVQTLEEKEDKDTTYTAGAGLQLSGTEFSVNPNDLPGTDQLVDINTRVTALENDTDADTKYTAGNGLILSGTEFSIDETKQVAVNTALGELIDSRIGYDGKKYETLKERLDNENNSYLIAGNTELGGNEPRELFKASLKSVRDTIDTTKFNIALGTDFHVDERTNPRYVNASLAYSHFNNLLYFDDKVDVTVVNGDNVDAMYSSLDRIKLETEAMVSKFLDNDTHSDVFIHLGNHDDGSGRGTDKNCPLDGFIKLEEYKEIYRTKQLLNGENRNNGSLYYYKDYPEKKIRLIGLYTEDITETITNEQGFLKYTRWLTHTIQQEQMDWLMNVALKNVPVDYHTVVIGHCPLYHGWTDNGSKQINHEFLKNVLLAFQRGTSFIGTSGEVDFPLSINCDFTTQGPRKFVGFFSGHTHQEMIDDWDGIKNVSCLHSIDIANSLNANTIKEDAHTIISIDTKASRVNLIGYGRATNRSYNY